MKKQRRYERLPWNTSQFLLWVVGDVRHALGGWVRGRTLLSSPGGVKDGLYSDQAGCVINVYSPCEKMIYLVLSR